MPAWLRNLTMLVGLGGWSATVVAYIVQHQLPDALLLGSLAGLIAALAPPSIGRRRRRDIDEQDEPPSHRDRG